MPGKSGSRKATRAEIIKVYGMLQDVLVDLGNGKWQYKEEHSDETVAIATGATEASVSGIRRELFGNLIIRQTNNDKRLDEVIRLANNLADRYVELQSRFNKLVLDLSLNKIANVRHLEIK